MIQELMRDTIMDPTVKRGILTKKRVASLLKNMMIFMPPKKKEGSMEIQKRHVLWTGFSSF